MKAYIKQSILISFFMILLQSCSQTGHDENTITVTIQPYRFFIQNLLGDSLFVNVMVPQGANPATYEPIPSQIKALHHSNLFFLVGHLGFEETWIPRLKKQFSSTEFVNASINIEPIKGHGEGNTAHKEGIDPHVWLSPSAVNEILKSIAFKLVEKWPDKKHVIENNLDKMLEKVKQTEQRFTKLFENEDSIAFLIFHPTLTYFARDYHLEQIPIEYEGKEPSPAYLKEIIDRARKNHVTTIFIQQEFDKTNAKTIADEIDGTIVEINPLRENWFETMDELYRHFQHIVNTQK